MRLIGRLGVFCAMVLCISGCSVHVQPSSVEFDRLCGKGPQLVVPKDEKAVSTAFFRLNWISSATIKQLVTQHGTPEAISAEREFLQPHRIKLFYPAQGQVYLLDQIGGEWLVAGSEPVENSDLARVFHETASRERREW
jgi:hypothetical protein